MRLKVLSLLSLLLFPSCLTSRVDINDLPEYKEKYETVQTYGELSIVQAEHIIELRAEIYKLWTYVLKSNKKRVIVFDLRDDKTKEKYEEYEEYIKEDD